MIQKVEMFTVICDNCGSDVAEGGEYSCWVDQESARDEAIENDWIEDSTRTKMYCPKCCSCDEEGNIILKSFTDKNP